MSRQFDSVAQGKMWRVIFYERRGRQIHVEKTGPWLPDKRTAKQWADWFLAMGYAVALQDQGGTLEKRFSGLPC